MVDKGNQYSFKLFLQVVVLTNLAKRASTIHIWFNQINTLIKHNKKDLRT